MLRVIKLVSVISILLSTGLCFAEQAKADPQLVRMLMQKSGLSKQIEQITSSMEAGIIESEKESGNKMSQEELSELLRIASEAFNAEILKDTVERHIRENLPEKDIRSVLQWLDSPLGKKIVKLEEESASPEAYSAIKKLSKAPIQKSERTALLSKLDDAVKATDIGVSITINLQVAFILAVSSDLPAEQRPSIEAVINEIHKGKPQLRETIERETIAGFLYTYRSLNDDEIRKYIAFAESDYGRKYHAVSAAGLNNALMQAGVALGGKLSRGRNEEGDGTI